ncbi:response regulator transcription factor [Clostridium cellulovorans]|uniref:Stage 0 sporulation protein A homolog n=1 Tax=Clostridium cellulovorans (strain ATCC 35296 / DSM 3052 / OCM 3 / 743B) TaxID=573061 RepID=D9SVR5_CLOC7|nr:response regulator transcription factor [Clostridium cellulovorans]ADL53126.1 two component transcriptional regulator, winged helix family [Clostridium cellulovorans 743B]
MKALIIEDDKFLLESICQSISEDFEYEYAMDGEEGLYMAEQNIYDVIILDIMLPSIDGYGILGKLREASVFTPVLILTAKDSIDDKIKGFKLGADDYLVKPFHREELLLRLEAIIRRNGNHLKDHVLTFKDLSLNTKNKTVFINDSEIFLQGKQFDILEYLLNNQGAILTKEQIFDRIWGFNSDTTVSVVEVYASNLRKSLKAHGYDKYIKTVRGLGYMLVPGEE